MKSVMLFSGGMDSVAGLKLHLKNHPNEDLHLLFVDWKNQRSLAERYVVTSLSKKYGLKLKIVDVTITPAMDIDLLIQVALGYHFQHRFDRIYINFKHKDFRTWNETVRDCDIYIPLQEVCDDVCSSTGIPSPEVKSLILGLTRVDEAKLIGDDVFWSCRNPVFKGEYLEPCNSCITCSFFETFGVKHPSLKIQEHY
jgi:7-cyano-7-deazaguanine synthase in queuosine biosynthesis